jgi:hypothetical protein
MIRCSEVIKLFGAPGAPGAGSGAVLVIVLGSSIVNWHQREETVQRWHEDVSVFCRSGMSLGFFDHVPRTWG